MFVSYVFASGWVAFAQRFGLGPQRLADVAQRVKLPGGIVQGARQCAIGLEDCVEGLSQDRS